MMTEDTRVHGVIWLGMSVLMILIATVASFAAGATRSWTAWYAALIGSRIDDKTWNELYFEQRDPATGLLSRGKDPITGENLVKPYTVNPKGYTYLASSILPCATNIVLVLRVVGFLLLVGNIISISAVLGATVKGFPNAQAGLGLPDTAEVIAFTFAEVGDAAWSSLLAFTFLLEGILVILWSFYLFHLRWPAFAFVALMLSVWMHTQAVVIVSISHGTDVSAIGIYILSGFWGIVCLALLKPLTITAIKADGLFGSAKPMDSHRVPDVESDSVPRAPYGALFWFGGVGVMTAMSTAALLSLIFAANHADTDAFVWLAAVIVPLVPTLIMSSYMMSQQKDEATEYCGLVGDVRKGMEAATSVVVTAPITFVKDSWISGTEAANKSLKP